MLTFEEMGLMPEIIKAVTELGFEQPMPVQEKVIPLLLKEKTDVVALAQTGTGKTAAFGLPVIQQIDTKSRNTQALIICPTRELCLQIADDLADFTKYMDDVHVLPVYGGSSIEAQIRALKNGVQIIVATPGRLIDLINRKAAKLNHVSKVILDEADEMLNMGFTEDINTILAQVPENRNTLLFSATMPPEIAAIARNYMSNPIEITIGKKNTGNENIKHLYYTVHAKDKYKVLKRIADYNPSIYGIVFCRTRKETQEVADKLMNDGYNADCLHGDLSQAQRDYVMQRFRLKQLNLLVATDVAARGIDVDDLTHVINYTLPDDVEAYTHRSGRTGRAGKTGISIAITHIREKHLLRQIERIINKQFQSAKIPTGRDICEKQLFNLIERMERVEVDNEIEKYIPQVLKKLEWLDKEELIKKFVSMEFNRFLEYYKNAGDIEVPVESKHEYADRGDRNSDRNKAPRERRQSVDGYSRLFINLGKEDGFYPNNLIELINSSTRGKRIDIGKIELMKTFSFFEVPEGDAKMLIDSMKKGQFKNRRIAVDFASSPEGSKKGDFNRNSNREKPKFPRNKYGNKRPENN